MPPPWSWAISPVMHAASSDIVHGSKLNIIIFSPLMVMMLMMPYCGKRQSQKSSRVRCRSRALGLADMMMRHSVLGVLLLAISLPWSRAASSTISIGEGHRVSVVSLWCVLSVMQASAAFFTVFPGVWWGNNAARYVANDTHIHTYIRIASMNQKVTGNQYIMTRWRIERRCRQNG